MKRYSSAQARQHLSELLDAAEQGEPVVIERHGVRFGLTAVRRAPARGARPRLFDWVDPAVEAGSYTWDLGPGGLRFRRRRKRS